MYDEHKILGKSNRLSNIMCGSVKRMDNVPIRSHCISSSYMSLPS